MQVGCGTFTCGMLCFSSPAHSATGLHCKCGAHLVQTVPKGGNSTMLPLPVTEIPLAECNGSSFCHTGRGGACYFKMREEPWELGYSVIFGCLRYQQSQELCPWGRRKEHDCCLSNDCNGRIGKSVNIMQLGLQCMWYGVYLSTYLRKLWSLYLGSFLLLAKMCILHSDLCLCLLQILYARVFSVVCYM